MFRPDHTTAVSSRPTPSTAGTPGWYTEGNPSTGVPATRVTADALNGITGELENILVAGGVTPSKTAVDQAAQSIRRFTAANVTVCPGGTYSLTYDHCGVVIVDATAGNVTVNLPAVAVTGGVFKPRFEFIRTDYSSNLVTVVPNGSNKIAESNTEITARQMRFGETLTLTSNGASWWYAIRERTRVISDLTLYVNPSTGNNGNLGLSASSPFATIQGAYDAAMRDYDFSGFTLVIQLAPGVYNSGLTAVEMPAGCRSVVLNGNTSAPANYSISVANASCVVAGPGATISVRGVRLTASGSNGDYITAGTGLAAQYGRISFANIEFGACGAAHIFAIGGGSSVSSDGTPYRITGNAPLHILSTLNAYVANVNSAITLVSALTITTFASAQNNASISGWGAVYTGSGTVTGTRYLVTTNGVINVNGGGPNVFPGTNAGGTTTGGQYN